VGWEHLNAVGGTFTLPSKNGSAVVFEVERLK
jgi:hypothetical protein